MQLENEEYKLGFVKIGRMYVEDDPEFAPAMKELVDNADALIIDLRGNKGGNSVPDSLLSLLTNQTITPLKSWRRKSPEALAIRANQFEYDKIEGDHYTQESIDKRNQEYFSHVENVFPEWKSDFHTLHGARAEPLGKPIYVLIDSDCASSTEETIAYLRYIPEVTFIGTNTMGAFHFGGCGSAFLPNSRLQLYCGARYVELFPRFPGDETFIEKTGFAPDIVSDNDGADAKIIAIHEASRHFIKLHNSPSHKKEKK